MELDRVSDRTLEKRKVAIEVELKKRALARGGQEYSEFRQLHSDPDCKVSVIYIHRTSPSGFLSTDMVEASLYHYVLKCSKHVAESSEFVDLSWLDGQVIK